MKEHVSAGIFDLFRTTAKPSIVLIAILALTFYLRLLSFGQYIDADVGNIGYLAWRMAEGEILIDLEGPGKPPLYSMLYAVFICLFGPSIIGLKIFGTVFVLMAVLGVYWLSNQAYGRKVGLLAAFLFGVFSSGPKVEGGTVNLETLLHLPCILSIGLFIKASESGRLRWYFLTGLCAAWATLVKQVGGVLFFVFLCHGIHEQWIKKGSLPVKQWVYPIRKPCHLWRGWRKKRSSLIESGIQSPALSNGVYRYILLAGGALVPIVGVWAFYHFHGYTLNQLYQSVVESNLVYIQRGHEYTSLESGLLQLFYSRMKGIVSENGVLWIGTMFAVVHLGWRIRQGKGEAIDRILLWWTFWSFAVLWTTGTFLWHYFLQMIGPFSVLAAYGIVTSWRLTRSLSPFSRFVARGGWMSLLVVLAIIFIKTDYRHFFSYTGAEQTMFQHELSNGVFDEYGIGQIVRHEIAYYIRDHTDPNETIYVWGIAPQIYFLAQRKAATRYRNNYNMTLIMTDDPMKALRTYASSVMEDLKRSPPAYIVQIFHLEDFPELQTFVRDHYKVDKDVKLLMPPRTILLYRRRRDIPTVPNPR